MKDTIIYELEMLVACIALGLWAPLLSAAYPVLFGDNDSVRFALIAGTGVGCVSECIMKRRLQMEMIFNTNVWFARVPTEANIADLPSRGVEHPWFVTEEDASNGTFGCLSNFVAVLKAGRNELKRKKG